MIHGYSGSNPRIRGLRRLARDRGQRYEKRSFIVEGPVLVAEALDAGLDVRLVVVPESPLDDLNAGRALDALLRGALATGADVGTVPDSILGQYSSHIECEGLPRTRRPERNISPKVCQDIKIITQVIAKKIPKNNICQ